MTIQASSPAPTAVRPEALGEALRLCREPCLKHVRDDWTFRDDHQIIGSFCRGCQERVLGWSLRQTCEGSLKAAKSLSVSWRVAEVSLRVELLNGKPQFSASSVGLSWVQYLQRRSWSRENQVGHRGKSLRLALGASC